MGHKKRMQMMRMEWINEGKPQSNPTDEAMFEEPTLPTRSNNEREKRAPKIAPIFEPRASERPKTPTADPGHDMDMDMDDLYDATPRPARPKSTGKNEPTSMFGGGSLFGQSVEVVDEEEPPEDELDALLAEEDEILRSTSANVQATGTAKKVPIAHNDVDDDEMEAMAEMEGMW